jgi:hypothetical protein
MKYSGFCGCGAKLTLEGSKKDLSISSSSNGSHKIMMKDVNKNWKDVVSIECPVCGLNPVLKIE